METISEEIKDLIISQLSGEIDTDGEETLQQWINSSHDHAEYYHKLREVWFSSAADESALSKYDTDTAYANFKAFTVAHSHRQAAPHRNFRMFYYAAAAVALILVCSYISFKGGQNILKSDFANIVVAAPQGSKTNITLPDGTQVCLNAGSKIEYSQGFGIENRDVRISGEGRFEVKENDKLAFSVQSDNLHVKDIGTVFDFRDYPSDAEAIVSLEHGKVAVSNLMQKEAEKILSPNQRVILNKADGTMRTETCEASKAKRWIEGILSFRGESMKQIANELERAYNVKITLKSDSMSSLHFYGDFYTDKQSLKEILEQLSATGELHFSIAGAHVTIY